MLLCIIVVIELGFAVRKTMSFRVPVLSRGSDETKDGLIFPRIQVGSVWWTAKSRSLIFNTLSIYDQRSQE